MKRPVQTNLDVGLLVGVWDSILVWKIMAYGVGDFKLFAFANVYYIHHSQWRIPPEFRSINK
jgi:hypothetical protein